MNKLYLISLALLLSPLSQSQTIGILDYDWKMNDIQTLGITRKALFSNMDRDLIKVGQSICSNRAHLWAYDMKKNDSVNSSKIFLFFTEKTGERGLITWWYHVAPVINEQGQAWVMDAGFPGMIKSPLSINEWLIQFAKTDKCKEIKATETDLIEHIFKSSVFPQETHYGKYSCYYKITPSTYWTPNAVAQNLLGRNSEGRPVSYNREEIELDEVYEACIEATTNPLGRIFGNGKKKCKKYLEE